MIYSSELLYSSFTQGYGRLHNLRSRATLCLIHLKRWEATQSAIASHAMPYSSREMRGFATCGCELFYGSSSYFTGLVGGTSR
jgi:hypothetical protein